MAAKKSIFETHLVPMLGSRRLDRITDKDVQRLKAKLSVAATFYTLLETAKLVGIVPPSTCARPLSPTLAGRGAPRRHAPELRFPPSSRRDSASCYRRFARTNTPCPAAASRRGTRSVCVGARCVSVRASGRSTRSLSTFSPTCSWRCRKAARTSSANDGVRRSSPVARRGPGALERRPSRRCTLQRRWPRWRRWLRP